MGKSKPRYSAVIIMYFNNLKKTLTEIFFLNKHKY